MDRRIKSGQNNKTNAAGDEALVIFKKLLSPEIDIEVKEDNVDSIDGYLVMKTSFQKLVKRHKLAFKIKRFPGKENKLDCPPSLIEYGQSFHNPVLLIGINVYQNKVFWIHIDESFSRENRTAIFEKKSRLDNDEHIGEWIKISQLHTLLKDIKDYMNQEESIGEDPVAVERLFETFDQLISDYRKVSKEEPVPKSPVVPIVKNVEDFDFSEIRVDRIFDTIEDENAFSEHLFQGYPVGKVFNKYSDKILLSTAMEGLVKIVLLIHQKSSFNVYKEKKNLGELKDITEERKPDLSKRKKTLGGWKKEFINILNEKEKEKNKISTARSALNVIIEVRNVFVHFPFEAIHADSCDHICFQLMAYMIEKFDCWDYLKPDTAEFIKERARKLPSDSSLSKLGLYE